MECSTSSHSNAAPVYCLGCARSLARVLELDTNILLTLEEGSHNKLWTVLSLGDSEGVFCLELLSEYVCTGYCEHYHVLKLQWIIVHL